MAGEDKNTEYKSIRKVLGKQVKLSDLAEECVAFSNAQGGTIIVGIEDDSLIPPNNQLIDIEEVNSVMSRLHSLACNVSITNPNIITHENGGMYFSFQIFPTNHTIATTSTGKVFVRIMDNCVPINGEDLTRLAAEKNAFQWELVETKYTLEQADEAAKLNFIRDIRQSPKISSFIKSRDDIELLLHYQLVTEDLILTNLGVLWLGTSTQRARLAYPITIQYIVYNDLGEKIRKLDWHFHQYSPKELLLDIERQAVELTYYKEIPNGLFRKQIRNYPEGVVRELLVNAIAHKQYTISGDIFIEVYPNKLVITNPGDLPLGITEYNILHERFRRNPHLIQTLHDLNLMEGEGSGYDLIYELLAKDGKQLPVIRHSFTKVEVTIQSEEADNELITILDYIQKNFLLTQKEFITLGIIAKEKKILTTQLFDKLQLSSHDRLRSWIGTLITKGIVGTRGIKKGMEYLLNPQLFAIAKLDIKPTLKTIEPFKLDALIEEDLKYNGKSSISDIHNRMSDVTLEDVRKAVYRLKAKEIIDDEGSKKYRVYYLAKKK